jgi:predicted transcriptional regulator
VPRPDLMPALGPEKYWEPDKWTARHALVCDLHLTGKNNNEIAELLDLTPSRISILLSDTRSHVYIQEQRQKIAASATDIIDRLHAMADDALEAIDDDLNIGEVELVKPANRAIRQKAAFGVLASLGYGPVSKNITATVDLPKDLLERSNETLNDMREIQANYRFVAPEEKGDSDAEG